MVIVGIILSGIDGSVSDFVFHILKISVFIGFSDFSYIRISAGLSDLILIVFVNRSEGDDEKEFQREEDINQDVLFKNNGKKEDDEAGNGGKNEI